MAKARTPELDPKAEGQVRFIKEEFLRRKKVTVEIEAVNDGIDFMYEKDAILVRDEYLERVEQIVMGPKRAKQTPAVRVVKGVYRLPIGGTRYNVVTALAEIDKQLGKLAATPNHLITVAGGPPPPVVPCPATEPEEVPDGIEPEPGVCQSSNGEGVRVFIADTGLVEGAAETHSWLAGVEGDTDPIETPGKIRPYVGHGTFVAGVARCMAPAADIFVADVFDVAGSALESDAIPKLDAALEQGFDIFNLTISTSTRDNLPLLTFDLWRQQLRQRKGVACVVAAGNNGSYLPFWPAAFPEMFAVGALAANGRNRAGFSNYGGWVDVYAPGRGLINAYATGDYTCIDEPYTGDVRHFYGMARWSGTSFSTPIVTGLIAARMSRTGENGVEAAAALLAKARSKAIPGVGAVLLPCEIGHCHYHHHMGGCDHCEHSCQPG
jgi:hypothetical protein